MIERLAVWDHLVQVTNLLSRLKMSQCITRIIQMNTMIRQMGMKKRRITTRIITEESITLEIREVVMLTGRISEVNRQDLNHVGDLISITGEESTTGADFISREEQVIAIKERRINRER